MNRVLARNRNAHREDNKLYPADRAVHDWYRFVLSFPPHLVQNYLQKFGVMSDQRVLDPFCGTGTVLVECKKQGIASAGIEANPMAHFASQVKVDWSIDPDYLLAHAQQVADIALARLRAQSIEDVTLFHVVYDQCNLHTLPDETMKLLLANSISPLPLHKTLVLLDCLDEQHDERCSNYEKLALAKALVTSISNLQFGPEVGVGKAKYDAPVIASWLACLRAMAHDLRNMRDKAATPTDIYLADSRHPQQVLAPHSIDAVITSPPYPNEKDYTRTTRLESVLLGFINNKAELQTLKRGLLRSNTRGVYKGDDDDQWVREHPEIQRIAEEIEARRVELGKTSGFERLYAKVTRLYFGGMARHLSALREVLRPGAQLAYVVGDQASYLRIMIPTGQLLADIAQSFGYELVGIDLFRTRLATATKQQLREEVVILRWTGNC